jgi:hypothetical protein
MSQLYPTWWDDLKLTETDKGDFLQSYFASNLPRVVRLLLENVLPRVRAGVDAWPLREMSADLGFELLRGFLKACELPSRVPLPWIAWEGPPEPGVVIAHEVAYDVAPWEERVANLIHYFIYRACMECHDMPSRVATEARYIAEWAQFILIGPVVEQELLRRGECHVGFDLAMYQGHAELLKRGDKSLEKQCEHLLLSMRRKVQGRHMPLGLLPKGQPRNGTPSARDEAAKQARDDRQGLAMGQIHLTAAERFPLRSDIPLVDATTEQLIKALDGKLNIWPVAAANGLRKDLQKETTQSFDPKAAPSYADDEETPSPAFFEWLRTQPDEQAQRIVRAIEGIRPSTKVALAAAIGIHRKTLNEWLAPFVAIWKGQH